jgi:hypothetical protein
MIDGGRAMPGDTRQLASARERADAGGPGGALVEVQLPERAQRFLGEDDVRGGRAVGQVVRLLAVEAEQERDWVRRQRVRASRSQGRTPVPMPCVIHARFPFLLQSVMPKMCAAWTASTDGSPTCSSTSRRAVSPK